MVEHELRWRQMSSQAVGRAGEEFACAYVESPHAVLGRNLRLEETIDILAMDADVLVVISENTAFRGFGLPEGR